MSPSSTTDRPAARTLGEELRRLRLSQPGREDRPMSQEQLARTLLVGGKGVVSLFESGSRIPPDDVIDRYAALPGAELTTLRKLRGMAIVEATAVADTHADGSASSGGAETPTSQLRRVRQPHRRLVIVSAAVFALGALVASATWWSLGRTPVQIDAVAIISPRGVVGATSTFDARITGLTSRDIWLDVQENEDPRHHPTERPCLRHGDRLTTADPLFIGAADATGKPFRITAFAVEPGSAADEALRQYAARPAGTDRYIGLVELPAGIQVVAVTYVERR